MEKDFELFDKFLIYDVTAPGCVRWKKIVPKYVQKSNAGLPFGSFDKQSNYFSGWFNGKKYKLHRIVWLLQTGNWPNNCVDHIDRDTKNNNIHNLRICTKGENKQNEKRRKDNKSGYKGVYFYKLTNKWRSVISINKKRISLGLFDTPEEAMLARKKAAAIYHPFCTDYQ